jgi:hypothetical protein
VNIQINETLGIAASISIERISINPNQARVEYKAPFLENLGVWAAMVGNPVGISMHP